MLFLDGASELPLWGNFCARLAAQPRCLVEDTVAGYLHVQPESCEEWQHLYCVLRNLQLSCWTSQEEHTSQSQPNITIPITKVSPWFRYALLKTKTKLQSILYYGPLHRCLFFTITKMYDAEGCQKCFSSLFENVDYEYLVDLLGQQLYRNIFSHFTGYPSM